MKFGLPLVDQLAGGRSPHGERGLKSDAAEIVADCVGRSPHGERGLKFRSAAIISKKSPASLPPRGAWIEIALGGEGSSPGDVAPPTGSVD